MVETPSFRAVISPVLETRTISGSEEVQLMPLFTSVFGVAVTVAVSWAVSPTFRDLVSGVTVTVIVGIVGTSSLTVISHLAVIEGFSLLFAVIVAFPWLTAVTSPLLFTVAIESLELLQVTLESEAVSGRTVAFKATCSPGFSKVYVS
nr:hypothetical protein [uncultured Intestinimonas sp.]